MLKEMLDYIGVTFPIQILDAPDILYPTKISTTLASN